MKLFLIVTATLLVGSAAYAQDELPKASVQGSAQAMNAGEATIQGLSTPNLASWAAVMTPDMKKHLYDSLLHPKNYVECPTKDNDDRRAGQDLDFKSDPAKCEFTKKEGFDNPSSSDDTSLPAAKN